MAEAVMNSYYIDIPAGKPTVETIDEFRKAASEAATQADAATGDAEELKRLVSHYEEWEGEDDE